MPQLILATRNQKKIAEIKDAMNRVSTGWDIAGLELFPHLGEVEETGSTFEENALIKARAVYGALTLSLYPSPLEGEGQTKERVWVLSDDSGIECDALGGAPGVYSARFAGKNATDEENNKKLILELDRRGMARHAPTKARYVCVMVLIAPDGHEHVVRETWEGEIILEPRGKNGFGYDPYFYIPELNKTAAALTLEEKNKISHRGKAVKKILHVLNTIHQTKSH